MANLPKITIVEDDAPIREMYKLKLVALGYDVSTANDGASALHVIEHAKPDLILLDIKLPHLPGNEVLKRVRDTDWGQSIKCIVLTNISKDEAPNDFRFLGVERYVVKVHYTPTQVMEIIQEVLQT
ncbi:MAG: response regulator [Prolixibacteraceae bacterium]|nr:response regulator [Prolixibacteraceae bacterium]